MKTKSKNGLLKKIYKQKILFFMSVPFVLYLLLFSYVPVWGWLLAFFDYKPGIALFSSKFVGLRYFKELFSDPGFYRALRNTLVLSFSGLILSTVVAVVFAVLLNEIWQTGFKRVVQTVSYLPHFVSWVIVAGIFSTLLSINNGTLNSLLIASHLIKNPIAFQQNGPLFWVIVNVAGLWKETGWNAIIYLAVIVTINPEQYEAAIMDGANRFRRIWHITLPGIKNTVIVLTVMSMGWLLGVGFDQSFLMGNGIVFNYSDVLATYIMRFGIDLGRFSYATAAGIFQSIIGIITILLANYLAKRFSNLRIM